ncbi:MAG: cbb3-type cytochrome c oxidase subunit I [Gemmatimonadota bacterium]
MSTVAPTPNYSDLFHDPSHEDHRSFVQKYIFSTDHKIIGIQFLFMSLLFLLIGGLLAMLIRWQLGWPGEPMPGGAALGETRMPGGIMLPEFYNSVMTMHGTIMIFFAVMPLLVGVYANFLIPLQIGAPDMAFPKLNMASFWIAVPAGVLMVAGFFVAGGHAAAGWTSYAPLSTNPEFTGVFTGQVLWTLSLIILGFSSLAGSVNYITTIVNMRAPGMTWFRLPLPTWALFITSILILLAIPVLTGALILLLFDQTLGTGFFNAEVGGQPLLWQHLFWYFGHPEVYILILPAFGFVSEIIANGARKPVFGYHAMVGAIASIAILGWIVWGHHMFQSGMNPMLGAGFMATTMVIAVPTAIKVFNWIATLWEGDLHFHSPMLYSLAFVSMFVIGGFSGIFLASTPVDIPLHDTYFVVAHIHYVLFGGSLFAIFAALTYWFPKMFGRLMNEGLNKVHFYLSFIFFNLVFFPMHELGNRGMMRRIYDYTQYGFLDGLVDINRLISLSAFALFAAQLIFAWNFIWSLFKGKKSGSNPWRANSLEWSVPSPAPHGNFTFMPTVYRGPYEYSSVESDEDYLPQDVPPAKPPVPEPEMTLA